VLFLQALVVKLGSTNETTRRSAAVLRSRVGLGYVFQESVINRKRADQIQFRASCKEGLTRSGRKITESLGNVAVRGEKMERATGERDGQQSV
jgi:hypothetical protein